MTAEAERERLLAAGWVALVLLLLAGLAVLVREALRTAPPPRRVLTTITQVVLPLPPPPPVPRHRPVPPEPVAAPEPVPRPVLPRPRAPIRAAARPLTAEPSPRPSAIPPGADAGIVIGGAEGGGQGAGFCGGSGYYDAMIASQLRGAIIRHEKTDGRSFHVRARLWFDGAGALQRAQLLGSTGDVGLDAAVRRLLNAIDVGPGMPGCLQPVLVWVTEPWEIWLGGTRETQSYQTQTQPRHVVHQSLGTEQY